MDAIASFLVTTPAVATLDAGKDKKSAKPSTRVAAAPDKKS